MRNRLWRKLIGVILCVCVILSSVGISNGNVLASEGDSEYYQQLNSNSNKYRECKESISKSTGKMKARSITNSTTLISNDYIEFNTLSSGRFSIGTVEGNPDIDTDNNKKMLFGHPAGSTSYTTVRIDGKSNQFQATDVLYDIENAQSVATTEYDGIQVIQTLSIIENENTKRGDLVKVSYELKNTSDISKSVGLRIMMDTMLGDNDAAPFRVNGLNITKETEFAGEDIPQTWMAFDSLSEPGVVSQGTFFKEEEETKPDKVQFTNWGRVRSIDWNYIINQNSSNGDSAVTMTWDEKSLEVGESYTYCTYYGLSELTYDLVPPIALGVYVDNTTLQYQGSYYQVNATAYIQNIGDGNAKDVKLWIETDNNFNLASVSDKKEISVMKPGDADTCTWTLRVNKDGSVVEDTTGIIRIKLQYTEENTGKVVNKEIEKNIIICKNHAERQAIIIVPGIMGSQLQNEDGKTVWPSIRTLGDSIKCDEYGNSLHTVSAISSSTEYGALDTYETLINDLRSNYGENYDIVFAPYDWRLGLDRSAAEIKCYIDKYDSVAVVAHSMGGLVLEKYIYDYGTSKIIKAVSVGTPFWGSIMAARAEFDGYIEAAHGFGGTLVEGLVENMEGIHNLLPDSFYTGIHKWCSVTTNQYDSFWDYITYANYKTELKDWNGTKEFYAEYCNKYLFNKSSNKLSQMHASNSCQLDKANTTYIVGNGNVTDSDATFFDGMILGKDGIVIPTKTSYSTPNNYGDGTVSMISATMNRINASSLNGDSVQYLGDFVVIKEVNHTNLVKKPNAIKEIKKALNESVVPNSGPVITNPRRKVSSAKMQASKNGETSEDYEDTSKVVQLILTGDIDIDFYRDNELKYFYHPNCENNLMDGPDFAIRAGGKFGDQNIVFVQFNKNNYTIKLTSNKKQTSQIGILNMQNLQSLSDFNLSEGDIVEIKYCPEKSSVYYNNSKIRFEGDDSLSSEDVSIMSLDTNMGDEGNTIGVRIKLKNCSDISIPLNEIVLGYIFDSDGLNNNVAEFDWVCNNNIDITNTVQGKFVSPDNSSNQKLNISFNNDQVLEVGDELEIHFRIHTTDWQNYNLKNDYSRNTSEYSVNERILMLYKNELVYGKECGNE